MNKTTKIIIGAIVVVIVAGGIWYGVSRKPAEKEAIKIGIILPLTGEFAFWGEETKRGLEIAADEDRKEGINLELVYEDDQSLSPTAAVNAANKLVNIDKIDVGLTLIIEESRPIAPIFNDNKIPLLILWDSNQFIRESGEYLFSNGFSTEKAGELMAEFAFNKVGLKKLAVISHVDAWAEIISAAFKNRFEKIGGIIVYDEQFQTTVTDYRTAISKMKQVNPDGVYFPLIPPNSARFLIQAYQLGLGVPLLTGDSLLQDVINEAGRAAEGVYYTNVYTDKASMIIEKYKANFGAEPIDPVLVSIGYDGIMRLVEAIKIPEKSLKESFDLIFGESRSADRLEKLYKVTNGKPVEVK